MYTISLFILLCAANGLAQKCIEAEDFERKWRVKKHILLVNSTSNSQDINYFKTFSDDVKVIEDICPGGVKGLIAATKLFPNSYIINLNVPDFYEFNYNEVSQHLIYGGDRDHSQREFDVCVVENLDALNITCNETTIQKFSYSPVKLMSSNVEEYAELYNAVNDFSGEGYVENHPGKAMQSKFILICTDVPNVKVLEYYNITFSSDCENDAMANQNNLIAVVTARPFETDYDIMVPIILYEAPCYDENISKVRNYVTMTTCDHYKYALLEFLKSVGWTRVAVVSDNAAYSDKFEQEIRALFDVNEFAYTVVKCHETLVGGCNFIEALKSLKKSDGRVFIANVDESNARIIQEEARHVWQQQNSLSSWIFRGFILTGDTEAMGDIYSLFLEPANNQDVYDNLQSLISSNIRYKNSIISAIQIIQHAYNKMMRDYDDMERKTFFRKLTNEIRKQLSPNVKVNVLLKNPEQVFTEMTIIDGKVTNLTKRQRRREDISSCTIRRKDYHNPCDDYNLLNIMIVLVVVASCGLVAAICYNRFDMTVRRYSNLE